MPLIEPRRPAESIQTYTGVKVLLNHLAAPSVEVATQYQAEYPRSKKRRIRNKWKKQGHRYRPTPMKGVARRDGVIVVHPAHLETMRARVDAELERMCFDVE
jgi:hypothetical protein